MNTFIHPFTHLHTATSSKSGGRTHWTAATRHRAPNKPLLLLTVIDLFAQGLITTNLIEPTDDLADLFALCKLCHWSFDEGLLGVSHRYQVIASKALTAHNNIAGHLLTLHERPLIAPVEEALWPDREALRWHRAQALRG